MRELVFASTFRRWVVAAVGPDGTAVIVKRCWTRRGAERLAEARRPSDPRVDAFLEAQGFVPLVRYQVRKFGRR